MKKYIKPTKLIIRFVPEELLTLSLERTCNINDLQGIEANDFFEH